MTTNLITTGHTRPFRVTDRARDPRPHPVGEARALTDAELAAQAELRSERLRTWVPTIVSFVGLLAIAVGGALLVGELASFGLYLVGGW